MTENKSSCFRFVEHWDDKGPVKLLFVTLEIRLNPQTDSWWAWKGIQRYVPKDIEGIAVCALDNDEFHVGMAKTDLFRALMDDIYTLKESI
jgi:hypothetical protein